MLKCKEIIKILNAEENLKFLKKIELCLHLTMCKHCSAYSKHLFYLKTGFKKLFARLTKVDAAAIDNLENKTIEKIKSRSD